MRVGYARVSTREQNLDSQIDALKKARCTTIHQEIVSGAKTDRPVLDTVIKGLRKGDVLVIWKLDRLGRTLKHLVTLVNDLLSRKVGIISLNDPIDTTTPQGNFAFNIFASLAEFERDLIIMRTQAGLSAAKARGRLGGRPKGLSESAKEKACAAETLYKEEKLSTRQIAKQLNISKTTLYSYLKHRNVTLTKETKSQTMATVE